MGAPTVTRRGALVVVAVDASTLGVVAARRGPNLVQLKRARDLAAGMYAALNGAMYADLGSTGRILYRVFDTQAGIDLPGSRRLDGITFSVVNGNVVVRSGANVQPGASVAVQTFPSLVRAGLAVPIADTESNRSRVWRAALVTGADPSRIGFAVARGSSLTDFRDKLIAARVQHAGYTDGGGSTSLVIEGVREGDAQDRAVATWLVSRANGSGSSRRTAVAVLGALGLFGYALHRRR